MSWVIISGLLFGFYVGLSEAYSADLGYRAINFFAGFFAGMILFFGTFSVLGGLLELMSL